MSRVADFEFLTPETEISPEFVKFSKKYGNLNKKSSFSSLERICLVVTNLPTLPAKGDELTMKFIESVGSSM